MDLPKFTTPFIVGAAAGAAFITILGFANGWVISAKANETQVRDAWIDAQAKICLARATTHLTETKSDVSLTGYQSEAREARENLARSYAVTLPGEQSPDDLVLSACAQMLNKPAS